MRSSPMRIEILEGFDILYHEKWEKIRESEQKSISAILFALQIRNRRLFYFSYFTIYEIFFKLFVRCQVFVDRHHI